MIKDSEVEGYLKKISDQMCELTKVVSTLLNAKPKEPKTELLTLEEAANYLKMARGTLYRKSSQGYIKRYKAGSLKFKVSDLDDYLLNGSSKTKQELTNEANDYCLRSKRK